jgi:hypothetical protein
MYLSKTFLHAKRSFSADINFVFCGSISFRVYANCACASPGKSPNGYQTYVGTCRSSSGLSVTHDWHWLHDGLNDGLAYGRHGWFRSRGFASNESARRGRQALTVSSPTEATCSLIKSVLVGCFGGGRAPTVSFVMGPAWIHFGAFAAFSRTLIPPFLCFLLAFPDFLLISRDWAFSWPIFSSKHSPVVPTPFQFRPDFSDSAVQLLGSFDSVTSHRNVSCSLGSFFNFALTFPILQSSHQSSFASSFTVEFTPR